MIIGGTLTRLLNSLPLPDDINWHMAVAGAYSLLDTPVSLIKSSSMVVIQYITTVHISTNVGLLSANSTSPDTNNRSSLIPHQGTAAGGGQGNQCELTISLA